MLGDIENRKSKGRVKDDLLIFLGSTRSMMVIAELG